MLELRPNCENCHKPLPPEALDACICSFECTFCRECVETVLLNVCPNCSGGFVERPIRPRKSLVNNPACQEPVYHPVDRDEHAKRMAEIVKIPPYLR